jgi:WD40 repeat protein
MGFNPRSSVVSFSFNSRFLAGSTADGKEVYVYDVKTMKEVRVPNLSVAAAHACLALSPDGTRLAVSRAGRYSPRTELIDVRTGKTIGTCGSSAACLAFSPDGKFVAAGEGVNQVGGPHVTIHTADGKKRVSRFFVPLSGDPRALTWSPDSRMIAIGSQDLLRSYQVDGTPHAALLTLRDCTLAISANGHYRGTPQAAADCEVVYIVQTDKGQETLSPAEMERKYGWKNDPKQVRLSPR